MKKYLAIIAMAALAVTANAQTNVTIYGNADVSAQAKRATGADAYRNHATVQSNGSYLGFKGAEDLGNGAQALFQIETGVNFTGSDNNRNSIDNGSAFGNNLRDTYVGVRTSSGTVLAGYLSTPYRSAIKSLDVFYGDGDTQVNNVFGRTVGAGVNFSPAVRANAVAYVLPSNSYGITGAIAYTGNNDNQNLSQKNGSGEAWSANVGFAASPTLSLIGAAQHTKVVSDTAVATSADNYLVGATYTGFENVKVAGGIGRNSLTLQTGEKVHSNSYYVGSSYRSGRHEPRISYVRTTNLSNDVGVDGATQWNVGYSYHLSKRTQAYALYSAIKNGDGGIYDFQSGPVATTVPLNGGNTVQTYGVGLRHSF